MLGERAYSTFQVKAFSESEGVIEGFASTPDLDRGGDVMEPAGAKFRLPMPLLWQHNHEKPLGHVLTAKTTPQGIYIKAKFETGVLPYIDDAWSQVKAGLVRGLSIGWRPLERPEMTAGGRRYSSWEWYETSAVTVPMNMKTTIAVVKSLDREHSAALGTEFRISIQLPGASGLRKGAAMTTSQQLTSARAELQTKSARLEELITKDGAEGGLEAAESAERDSLLGAVKTLSVQMDQLSALEQAQKHLATVIPARPALQPNQNQIPKVEVKSLPKGTAFTRYAMAIAAGRGSFSDTLAYAKRFEGQTPEVVAHIKAMFGKAVEGTTVENSPAWGHQLVYQNNLASEFIELLRPRTIMGRIEGLRRVPPNVRMVAQTDGATVNWVGQSQVKPVSDLGFDEVSIGYHKIAGIVVLSEELVRLSSPSAEEAVRNDLVQQIGRFRDQQFIDPTVTASTARPASITQGVSSPSASGTTAEDLYYDMNLALATFDNADQSVESLVVLMTPALARGISTLRNALGQFEFPGLSMAGGVFMGFPVIVSSSVPSGHIILVAANEVFVADDGNVNLDASNQATLDMSGGASPTVSLWQRNLIGIRAEMHITWKKRRDESVAIIDTASYGPTAPS